MALSVAGITSFTGIFRRFSGLSAHDVAQVDGYDITQAVLRHKTMNIEQRIAYIKQQFGESAPYFLKSFGMQGNPKDIALQELIQDKLLLVCADQISIHLSNEFITQKLDDPSFMIQNLGEYIIPQVFDPLGGINQKALIEFLRMQGLTLDDFEQAVEAIIKRMLVMALVTGAVYIPEFVLKEHFIKDFSPKDFSIIFFPFNHYLKKAEEQKATSEELKAYFEAQNSQARRYWAPEERKAHVWTFDMKTYGLTVSDKEIEDYYRKNKNSYIEKAEEIELRRILFVVDEKHPEAEQQEKAEKIYQEIVAQPAKFAELAHQYSDDKDSAKKGGLIGFISQNDTSKWDSNFLQAAFALSRDGDISLPTRTAQGFEILGRVSKKNASYKSLASVRQDITNQLLEERFKKLFMSDARRILTSGDQTAFDTWVTSKKAHLATGTYKKDESLLARKLFELTAAKKISYSEGQKGYIMELVTINQAHPHDFDAVSKNVADDYYREQTFKMLGNALKEGHALLPNLKSLKKDFSATIEKLTGVTAQSPALDFLKKQGIPDRFFKVTAPNKVQEALTEAGGYLIVLDQVAPFDEKAFEEQKKDLKKRLMQEQLSLFINGFIASLQKNVKIKVNSQNT